MALYLTNQCQQIHVESHYNKQERRVCQIQDRHANFSDGRAETRETEHDIEFAFILLATTPVIHNVGWISKFQYLYTFTYFQP